jgi:hypothetical protein
MYFFVMSMLWKKAFFNLPTWRRFRTAAEVVDLTAASIIILTFLSSSRIRKMLEESLEKSPSLI